MEVFLGISEETFLKGREKRPQPYIIRSWLGLGQLETRNVLQGLNTVISPHSFQAAASTHHYRVICNSFVCP